MKASNGTEQASLHEKHLSPAGCNKSMHTLDCNKEADFTRLLIKKKTQLLSERSHQIIKCATLGLKS
jgi:hypothetical protein